MQGKISVRGQTVVPSEIRKALGIRPGQWLHWELASGRAIVRVLPEDPVRASVGFLKGVLPYEEFIDERQRDRKRERELDGR